MLFYLYSGCRIVTRFQKQRWQLNNFSQTHKNPLSLSLPSLTFFLPQCESLPPTSSLTSSTYRTIPQPSQEPASPWESGSSLLKRRFCSMTTSLLSTTSFTRCVHMSFDLFSVCMNQVFVGLFEQFPLFVHCRLLMMWRKASSKQSRSPTSCRSWRSRRRCLWSVSHIHQTPNSSSLLLLGNLLSDR